MAINVLCEGYTETAMIEAETVSGQPVFDGSNNFLGISLTDSAAVDMTKPTSFAAALAGAGGEWPASKYCLYAVTAVNSDGKEGLPAFVMAGATGADDEVQLSWDAVAGADHYNVYRGESGASAAAAGTDLVFLAEASSNSLNDDGYQHTQRGTSSDFEEVLVKASSLRVPSVRDAENARIVDGMIVSLLKRGVVEIEAVPGANGIPSIIEGIDIQWDVSEEQVTTEAVGGDRYNIGKATLAYPTSGTTVNKVAVSILI